MKNVYKYIIAASLIIPLVANAQQDTLLNRQVLLERDYNPTLQDASKINTVPSIYKPILAPVNAGYQEQSPNITLNRNLLGKVGSGDIRTGVDYNNKKGYLILGAGSNANIEGAIGYKLIDSPTDILNLFATHGSTSGNVDYADDDFATTKAKAKYSDSKVNINYRHLFEPYILCFGAYYRNMNYNYYGNPYWDKNMTFDPSLFELNKRQGVDVYNFNAALESSNKNAGILKYRGYAGYSYFKNKYGPLIELDGIKGGQLNLGLDFYTGFDADKTIGVKGKVMNQSISDPNFTAYKNDSFHSLTNIEIAPYFNIEGVNWNINLGINAGYALDSKNKFNISPDIQIAATIAEKNKLYLKATGGINENSFLQILDENRYVNQMTRVGYSRTPFDISAGFNIGAVQGFEFGIFGGYKQTKGDHLFISTSHWLSYDESTPPNITTNFYSWSNLSTPIYADVSTGHFGGFLKTNLIPKTDLSVRATGFFYDVKYKGGYIPTFLFSDLHPTEEKAWGRPTFTAGVNADINVLPQLDLSLSYNYAGGRKGYLANTQSTYSMNDINEFNIRAEYKITDWASVYVRANNILNQKYESIQGYTKQGFNALGGLSFKF